MVTTATGAVSLSSSALTTPGTRYYDVSPQLGTRRHQLPVYQPYCADGANRLKKGSDANENW